jgi:radical SAM superfamily enzyme YgiQ (UPF0313 family)
VNVTFVTTGLEHLGVEALVAWVRLNGHHPTVVYEPRPFSTDTGANNPLLSRLFEPAPDDAARRVLDTRPDVVAFSSYSRTHGWLVEVARAIKRDRRVPVVFGGAHVTGDPARSIREPAIDAVVVGEGEGAILDLLDCATPDGFARRDIPNVWVRGGDGPIGNPCRPLIEDLDSLPFGERDGFFAAAPALERRLLAMGHRGCPFRCAYCEHSTFRARYPRGRHVRQRSVSHLLDELRVYRRRGIASTVSFEDAILTCDLRWMREFADRYPIDIGLPFECYAHPRACGPAVVETLARAGCVIVRLGVQSVRPATLDRMERPAYSGAVREAVHRLHGAGIRVSLDHMLGFPWETEADQVEAARFYNEVRPDRVICHWMSWLPGTVATSQAVHEGILTADQVDRIGSGATPASFDGPHEGRRAESGDLHRLAALLDLIPLVPPPLVAWLLRVGAWRKVPGGMVAHQAIGVWLAIRGDRSNREHMRVIMGLAAREVARGARRRAARPVLPAPRAGS